MVKVFLTVSMASSTKTLSLLSPRKRDDLPREKVSLLFLPFQARIWQIKINKNWFIIRIDFL
jgi:hypothetical protein